MIGIDDMRVLITGKGGQLAWELERSAPNGVELKSIGRGELDITKSAAVFDAVEGFRPDIIINAAAYTAVDKAESEAAAAYASNETGPRALAEACKHLNARLIHVSTDFVFDGQKTTPYCPDDATNPLGVYGASKLAGEKAVLATLPGEGLIVRTAWVYSSHGSNFVKTMLRLMNEKSALNVVSDQVGSPTWARGLAVSLWRAVDKAKLHGVYHWTDAGVASWYDFAVAIQELAMEKGLVKNAIPIKPIPTAAYPTPAARPSFSVLDKATTEEALGLETIHWRRQLSAMLDELITQQDENKAATT